MLKHVSQQVTQGTYSTIWPIYTDHVSAVRSKPPNFTSRWHNGAGRSTRSFSIYSTLAKSPSNTWRDIVLSMAQKEGDKSRPYIVLHLLVASSYEFHPKQNRQSSWVCKYCEWTTHSLQTLETCAGTVYLQSMIMVRVSLSLASWKGGWPHTNMNRITPRLQISEEEGDTQTKCNQMDISVMYNIMFIQSTLVVMWAVIFYFFPRQINYWINSAII